jgi:hypothetical protein
MAFREQALAALHAIGDIVGEEHAIAAPGLGRQEGVEARDALHARQRQAQLARNERQGVRRNVVQGLLDFAQDLQQSCRVVAPACDRLAHQRLDVRCLLRRLRDCHSRPPILFPGRRLRRGRASDNFGKPLQERVNPLPHLGE